MAPQDVAKQKVTSSYMRTFFKHSLKVLVFSKSKLKGIEQNVMFWTKTTMKV